MFTGLGLIVGPPLGGWLYQAGGYELPFLVLGCVVLLMVPFNIMVMPSCGKGTEISVQDWIMSLLEYVTIKEDSPVLIM